MSIWELIPMDDMQRKYMYASLTGYKFNKSNGLFEEPKAYVPREDD